jgi:hypothetical protein
VRIPYFRGEPENKRVSTDEFARRLSEYAALRRRQEERAITRAPALSQHRLPVTKWQESSIFGMERAGNRSPAERSPHSARPLADFSSFWDCVSPDPRNPVGRPPGTMGLASARWHCWASTTCSRPARRVDTIQLGSRVAECAPLASQSRPFLGLHDHASILPTTRADCEIYSSCSYSFSFSFSLLQMSEVPPDQRSTCHPLQHRRGGRSGLHPRRARISWG